MLVKRNFLSNYFKEKLISLPTALKLKGKTNNLVPMKSSKNNLLQLMAFEPNADPRVVWECKSAAKNFNVTFIGLHTNPYPMPTFEFRDGYLIKRVDKKYNHPRYWREFILRAVPFYPLRYRLLFLPLFFDTIFKQSVAKVKSLFLNKAPSHFSRLTSLLIRAMKLSNRILKRIINTRFSPVHKLRKKIFFQKFTRYITRVRSITRLYIPSVYKDIITRRSFHRVSRLLKNIIFSPLYLLSFSLGANIISSRFGYFTWCIRYHILPTYDVFMQEIAALPEKPDVIHCNDLDTLLVGIAAKKKYGCKVIYDSHESWPDMQPNTPWYHFLFFKIYEKFLIRQADHVITVSPYLAKHFQKQYKLKMVHCVPNVAPLEIEQPCPFNVIESYAKGRIKFLFQGGFAQGRGIEDFIHAWCKVDHTKAALFLRGHHTEIKEGCITLAEKLGVLNKSVYFLDPVTEDELISAAKEADIGIIPYKPVNTSYINCCPNKLSQYMQSGLMILSNDLPYMRDIINKSNCGITYNNTIEGIVAAVNRCISSPDLVNQCKKSSKIFVQNDFNWDNYYRLLNDLYLN